MKITDVVTRAFSHPLDGTLRNPMFRWTEKSTLLVFVRTDTGLVGVGEAWCAAGTATAVEAFIAGDVRPELIGEDPDLTEAIMRRARRRCAMSGRKSETDKALSAIDIALWDIRGQALGLPIWRLLGGNDPRVAAYASGGLYRDGQSAEAFAAEHAAEVARGFPGIKIKVGGASRAVDLARVTALRAAVGPEIAIMVDGVAAMEVPAAIALARALAPADVKWFEQPVPNENLSGLARIRIEGGLPTAGNENESGLDAFRRLIGAGAVDYVQFDPVISGGFTEGRKIAALAEAHHLPVTLHHSNSAVSMLANIHLAAALANCESIEYHMLHRQLFDRVAPAAFAVENGYVTAPECPGLGIDLGDCAPW